jgi:hypothetical protein
MTHKVDSEQSQVIRDEIIELERRLQDAKARLSAANGQSLVTSSPVLEKAVLSSNETCSSKGFN